MKIQGKISKGSTFFFNLKKMNTNLDVMYFFGLKK